MQSSKYMLRFKWKTQLCENTKEEVKNSSQGRREDVGEHLTKTKYASDLEDDRLSTTELGLQDFCDLLRL